jgi:HEAT repeat protein
MELTRRRIIGIGLLVVPSLAITAWWVWPETPQQKVRRLLREIDSLPTGKFDISLSSLLGRSGKRIDAEWQRLGPESVPALVDALNDNRGSSMRYLAAGRLSEIGDLSAVPGLIQALQDCDFIVRMWAVHALGDMGDLRAIEPLIQRLEDEASCVRSAAAKALGRLGDRRAVRPLIRLLADEDWWTRVETTTALGCLGDGNAIDPIRHLMMNDKTDSIREEGEKALRKLGFELDR